VGLEELKRISTLNDKIDSLNDKIKKYQRDISDLQKEINSLKESLNQSVQKLTQTEQKLTETDHELREARDLLSWKTQMVEDLHRIIFDAEYDAWFDSQWRFMEREDFRDFLSRLRSVFG